MDDIDWSMLSALFEYKNITKTAEYLRISQPAITYRLNKLEEAFGVKIAYRGHRGIALTPQGEFLADYSTRMLKELQQTRESVLNFENKVQGTLRISASSIFSRYKLPAILSEFNEKYPLVEFHVITGWSEDVFNAIYKDQSQIGILRGSYNFSHVKNLLMEEKLLIVSKEEIDLSNLPNLPRIYYNTDTSLKSLMDNWWYENYDSLPSITMRVDNMETCKELVLNGLGYAVLPNILLKDDDNLHSYPCLHKDGSFVKRETWLIHKEEQGNNVVVNAFCEFMNEWEF
ncbi:MAG TPA: LysR family transcriptional regulator [Candidatus Avamphibacillus sp.]|nr:LysR family transcriptional regulator [Candidatus Avamphibacillus sp.]